MSTKNNQVCLNLFRGLNDLLRCLAGADDYILDRLRGQMFRRRFLQMKEIFSYLRTIRLLTIRESVTIIGTKRDGLVT